MKKLELKRLRQSVQVALPGSGRAVRFEPRPFHATAGVLSHHSTYTASNCASSERTRESQSLGKSLQLNLYKNFNINMNGFKITNRVDL